MKESVFKRKYAIIVAAGSGSRMGTDIPKQLLPFGGSTVLETTVRRFAELPDIDEILIASPADGSLDAAYEVIRDRLTAEAGKPISIVRGGDTRGGSVQNALFLASDRASCENVDASEVMVLIHDAARPGLSAEIIRSGIEAMDSCRAVVTAVPAVDSIRIISDYSLNKEPAYPIIMSTNVRRESVYCVQTPQIFRLSDISEAYSLAASDGFEGTDDASVAEHSGIEVAIVRGSRANSKITTKEDLQLSTRVGNGYDVHKLVPNRDLILCGTPIPSKLGLDGHSDADVATHALMDALLGAAGMGDIGRHFPDTDAKYKGANSLKLLAEVKAMLGEAKVGNVDITIIAQEPKLAPYNEQMTENIAKTLGVPKSAVNIKATTEEGLGFTGRGEGIAAFATAAIEGSF